MKFHLKPAACRPEENVLLHAREGTSYQNMHAQFSVVSTPAQRAPGGGGPLPITLTAVYQTTLNSRRGQDVSLFVDDTFSYFRLILEDTPAVAYLGQYSPDCLLLSNLPSLSALEAVDRWPNRPYCRGHRRYSRFPPETPKKPKKEARCESAVKEFCRVSL